jgi:hypothetical protein
MSVTSAREYLVRLDLLFHGWIAPPLFAFVYLYLELRDGGMNPYFVPESGVAMQDVLITGIWLVTMGAAYYTYRHRLPAIQAMVSVHHKMVPFKQLLRLVSMLLFLASIYCVGGLYFYNKNWYIILYFATLIHLSIYRPGPQRTAQALGLKDREYEIMLKRESFD